MEKATHIPLADIKAQYRSVQPEIDAAVAHVLASGRFVNGLETEFFEREFAQYLGARHAVAVANGTDALAIALLAAGLEPGDEVLLPAHTFHATVEAVYLAGMTPRLADVDPSSLCMSGEYFLRSLTERTRAVIPVHLYGYPAPLPEIIEPARERGILVIEDAAQAHGCRLQGRHVGTWGTAGAFSFFPGKVLGAFGDGGMVVTNEDDLAAKMRRLRDHGRPSKQGEIGRNSRLDEIQAAILRVKLPHLDAWCERRRDIDRRYRERAQERHMLAYLPLPDDIAPAPLNVVVQTTLRDDLCAFLETKGIASKPHYPKPIHLLPAYAHLGDGGDSFPRARAAAQKVLSLPNFPEMTDAQVEYVADALAQFADKRLGAIPTGV